MKKLINTKNSINTPLLLILATAAIVRFWGINFCLPHSMGRPDENVVVTTALKFGTGDLNPHFFIYPTFYMYLLFFLYIVYYSFGKITGRYLESSDLAQEFYINPTNFYLISRCVSALFGTASVFVIYQISQTIYNKRVAYLASLFLALAYLHTRDSHFGVTDVTVTFFVLLSVLFIMKATQNPKMINYGLAGIFAGLAMSTKYIGIMLLPSMFLAHFFNINGEGFYKLFLDKRILLFIVYFLLLFGLTSPFVVLSLPEFFNDFTSATNLVTSNDSTSAFSDRGWFYHFQYTLFYGLGWTLLFASIGGILHAFKVDPKKSLVLYSFPFIYYFVAGYGHTTFHRYMVPVVPFFCLAGACFIDFIAQKIANMIKDNTQCTVRKWGNYLALALAVLTILPSTNNIIHFNGLLAQKDNRLVATDWFSSKIDSGSSIYHAAGLGFEQLQLKETLDSLQREYNYIQENNLDLPLVEYRLKRKIDFYNKYPNMVGYKEYFLDKEESKFYEHYLQQFSSKNAGFFDKKFNAFFDEATDIPDYIIVYRSYVPYTPPLKIKRLIDTSYKLKHKFESMDFSDKRNFFDKGDAFYIPYSGFKNVKRPGPNIYIYEKSY